MAHTHPPHVGDASSVRVATLTVSSSRTPDDDEGGRILVELVTGAGFAHVGHAIAPDARDAIRAYFTSAIDQGSCDAVVITGGTGIAPLDVTYGAVADVLDDTLDGFGEAFRRLSWDQIGARAVLSRAVGGRYKRGLVFALPGSPAAVRLGMTSLIAPMLAHAVALVKG